ncbi:MAG: hypothetical protein V1835_07415 [Candidatus Micrarchaeota archaeon]
MAVEKAPGTIRGLLEKHRELHVHNSNYLSQRNTMATAENILKHGILVPSMALRLERRFKGRIRFGADFPLDEITSPNEIFFNSYGVDVAKELGERLSTNCSGVEIIFRKGLSREDGPKTGKGFVYTDGIKSRIQPRFIVAVALPKANGKEQADMTKKLKKGGKPIYSHEGRLLWAPGK